MRVISARIAVKLPEDIGFDQAASMMLKGMTAQFLVKRICTAKTGDTVLFMRRPPVSDPSPANG